MTLRQHYGLILPALLLMLGASRVLAQAPALHPIDIGDHASPSQFAYLSPLLKNAEVVSLAESIHMTHEFPLARIGMVKWMNEHLGYSLLAIEGSPEDLWVSQDVFLRDPSDLNESTSGLFGVWNTAEIKQLFRYEAETWKTSHPLYITAYDIQPGTGRASHGVKVFQLLAKSLTQYAQPALGLDVQAWSRNFDPLLQSCSTYKTTDEGQITQAIGVLQEWIDRAAPKVESAYPHLPHAAMLRLIPENLRSSLALCKGVAGAKSSADADLDDDAYIYKTTRDKNAALSALRVREAAPQKKLILWAHVSHLSYDAEEKSTSVGEILHRSLGSKLYTVGTFAGSGGTIMLFSDWDDDVHYGEISGVSSPLKEIFEGSCKGICFSDLRKTPPESPLATPQSVWFEARPSRMTLSKDFDAIIWVPEIHPPPELCAELGCKPLPAGATH